MIAFNFSPACWCCDKACNKDTTALLHISSDMSFLSSGILNRRHHNDICQHGKDSKPKSVGVGKGDVGCVGAWISRCWRL